MRGLTIRAARADEYDEVARVWMDSWVSVGLEPASDKLLADLRARIARRSTERLEPLCGRRRGADRRACWRSDCATATSISSSSILPITAAGSARCCCNSRASCPTRYGSMRKPNEKAWRWYEREGFVLEKEEPHPDHGLMMRYYRWKKGPTDDEALLGSANARRHRDLDDGGSRPALRARADRYLRRRAEEAGVSGDQSHGQGPGPAGRRGDDGRSGCDLRLRRRPLPAGEAWRRRSATHAARNIFTGCSSRRAASSPRSCRSSPSWRCLPAPPAGATPRRCSTCWTRRWRKARGCSATTSAPATS